MLFTSPAFLVFLPFVFLLYWLFSRHHFYQNLVLLLSSYVFYGWWNWKFLGLLLFSTLLDYSFGFLVAEGSAVRKKVFFIASILNNLLVLGIFKYYNFFAHELQHALAGAGITIDPLFLSVALPVGVSFYTFHGMSYVFDIYYRKIRPVRSFINYAVFVSFFPLLVAGPIERAWHMLPQVSQPRRFDYDRAVGGMRLILWGFFKKLVIADTLAVPINHIFSTYTTYQGSTLVLGAVFFSFQIYACFSGYTDIAIGVARLLGFEILSNFKFPYFSRDPAEFWRRWHISLSSWFRDYLYIPMGGSKGRKLLVVRNIFVVFLVSGFWHGANWTFLAWGAIHALGFIPLLLLGLHRQHATGIVAEQRSYPTIREGCAMLATFLFVTFAWVFFRSETIGKAIDYLRQMRHGLFTHPDYLALLGWYILPFLLIDWYFRRNERELRLPSRRWMRYAVYMLAIGLIISHLGSNSSFMYFQF